MNAPGALRRVSSLYTAALDLPPPFIVGMSSEVADVAPRPGSESAVATRLAALPLQIYWEVFDPILTPCDEPVAGAIADDLGDIYRDVARGLVLFESGRRDEALWEWGFSFQTHWGEHATGALRALHAYLARESPEGLSLCAP